MVYIKRRCHLSRKNQIILFLSAIFFMIYYVICHLLAVERIVDLDFTKQLTHEVVKTTNNITETGHIDLLNIKTSHKYSPVWLTLHLISQTHENLHQNLTNQQHTQGDGTNTLRMKKILITGRPLSLRVRETINEYIEKTLRESLKEDKGTGCDIPKLNPFAAEIMQFDKRMPEIVCSGHDWVKCYFSKCTIEQKIIDKIGDEIECTYNDILYKSDTKYTIGPPTVLQGNQVYMLQKSDHVKIKCKLGPNIPNNHSGEKQWSGHGIGYRPLTPLKPPPGRENTFNVLIFGFDSTSKNGFIRKMPKSYKFLTEELDAVVLNSYNIVGDGTPAALFPLLTGKTELELPESRRSIANSGYLDDMPWIFYKLKKDGYRTAYYEDLPEIGTFQYRFNGFRHQPADHYLRDFYLEADKHAEKGEMGKYCVGDTPRFKLMMNITDQADKYAEKRAMGKYCVGDTPRFKLMMNITDQFLKLDGKRFAFTFVADITHNEFNMIFNADQPFVDFLSGLKERGVFKDTLLIVMGDHGPRYADVRQTLQGKMEERLPFMSIRLPDNLKETRPEAFDNLLNNADTLTTIHDVHAMILDVLDMREHWNDYKVQGADLTRGLSLLETINKNRSCSEAAIEPHWCTCLKWEPVRPDEPMFKRAAQALLDHINHITEFQRSKCAVRTLTSIDWVTKKRTNKKLLEFQGAKDHDGYVGKFGPAIKLAKDVYQVKITVGPGTGVYEGAVTHLVKDDQFSINTREISRINAYNKEPECISAVYPHLNMFCYCNT